MTAPRIECYDFDHLDATTLYAILRLRVDVFVVEQRCAYPEIDGRDTEATTRHVVARDGDHVVGYLRLLTEPGGARRIGRVCVARDVRGRGVAGGLVAAALNYAGADQVVLDAQTYLQGWYAARGFVVTGPEFVEDGIPHVPMRRAPADPVS